MPLMIAPALTGRILKLGDDNDTAGTPPSLDAGRIETDIGLCSRKLFKLSAPVLLLVWSKKDGGTELGVLVDEMLPSAEWLFSVLSAAATCCWAMSLSCSCARAREFATFPVLFFFVVAATFVFSCSLARMIESRNPPALTFPTAITGSSLVSSVGGLGLLDDSDDSPKTGEFLSTWNFFTILSKRCSGEVSASLVDMRSCSLVSSSATRCLRISSPFFKIDLGGRFFFIRI